MGIGKITGIAAGVFGLGAAAAFVGHDLVSAFNAHAADPAVQTWTKIAGAAIGAAGGLYVGWQKILHPVLHPKSSGNGTSGAMGASIIVAPFALALTLLVSAAGGYGGHRAASYFLENVAAAKPVPAKPQP